jgi:hypothetical protein
MRAAGRAAMAVVAAGMTAALALTAPAGLASTWSGWSVQPTPNPPGATGASTLLGISCLPAGTCMAVGMHLGSDGAESALAERWDGSRWLIRAVPGAGGPLNAVSCTSRDACLAVGGDRRPLAARWDGAAWSAVPVPAPRGATRAALLSVSCPAASSCVAAGRYVAPGNIEQPLLVSWDGTRWTRTAAASLPAPAVLAAVSCRATTDCTAIGSYFRAGRQLGYSLHWNGTAWAATLVPSPPRATAVQLTGVSCPAAAECIAVGSASAPRGTAAVTELWNGRTWTPRRTTGPPGRPGAPAVLSAVSCRSATDCTAVGSFLNRTGTSRPLAVSWDRHAWSAAAPPAPSALDTALRAVSCVPHGGCTATGDYSADNVAVTTLAEYRG